MLSSDAALSYSDTPPLAAPFRFFVTGPLFGVLAGLLLMVEGETVLQSRWAPSMLALTHLMGVGFMLSVMLGALVQVLPVVAGAAFSHPLRIAKWSHALVTAGALLLALGLNKMNPLLLQGAVVALGAGIGVFAVPMLWRLAHLRLTQAVNRDLSLAALALLITVLLGAALVLMLTQQWAGTEAFSLLVLLKLHVAWAWLGWAGCLLAAVSWVVVPMFQITPAYPSPVKAYWAKAAFLLLLIWSVGQAWALPDELMFGLIALGMVFPLTTLWLQRQTRRAKPDATYRGFQLAMFSFVVGALMLAIGSLQPNPLLEVGGGIAILYGGFVGVVEAMLYKIVPFLVWLHLTQAGKTPPNIKKILPEKWIQRQMRLHVLAFLGVLGAAGWGGEVLTRVAGSLVCLEFGVLTYSIGQAIRLYRHLLMDVPAAQATPRR